MIEKMLWLGGILVAGVIFSMVEGKLGGKNLEESTPMIVHNVFFTLKESNDANRKKLVESCRKYLTRHDGEVFFAAGPIGEAFNEPVNDRDFDVALTIVFKNKAAHDKYQTDKRHVDFISENKETWKKVRVFDSLNDK